MLGRNLRRAISIVLLAGVSLNLAGNELCADEPPAAVTPDDGMKPLDLAADLLLIRARNEEILDQVQNKRVSAEFRNTPLDHAIAHLAELSGIPMQLDTVALEEVGIAVDEQCSVSVKNARVSSALSRLLEPLELNWTIENESLQITTNEVIDESLHAKVVFAGDIVEWFRQNSRSDDGRDRFGFAEPIIISSARAPGFGAEGEAHEILIGLIQQHCGGIWQELDGAGGTISFQGGLLTVRQSLPVLLQVESFLNRLRFIQKRSPSSDVWMIPEGGFGWPENRKAMDALQKRVSVKFKETPLHDALDYLGNELQIQIEVDDASLDEIGLLDSDPVSLTMSGTAGAVLKQIFATLQLTWIIQDDMLLVTTVEASDEKLFAVVADTRKLLATGRLTDARLVETILNETNGFWEDIDGIGGSIETAGGLTFIRQTQATIAEISVLLRDLESRSALLEPSKVENGPVDSNRMETRFYNAGSKEDAEALMTALTSFVFPDKWETNGGDGVMVEVGSRLVIRQTSEVHKVIAEFIRELSAAGQDGPAGKSR
tara:strand:- start:81792 stop:83426 length:1635 start_codon:yes stop_codon:yes gene_type:complete